MSKIRVLLADDHETILSRVSSIFGEDFEVVGTVGNGRDAVTEVQRLDPDVLVIDISMPVFGRIAGGVKVAPETVSNQGGVLDGARRSRLYGRCACRRRFRLCCEIANVLRSCTCHSRSSARKHIRFAVNTAEVSAT